MDTKVPLGVPLGADAERDSVQSLRPYRFDLIDPASMLRLARVMHEGALTHPDADSWRGLTINEHLNHALIHIYAFFREVHGTHLDHAFARLMMAVAIDQRLDDLCVGRVRAPKPPKPPKPLTPSGLQEGQEDNEDDGYPD